VGGFVRDLLLQVRNLDLDIVIEGDGIDFARRLAKRLHGTVRAHEKFNTAVVKLADGFKIDVATARLEYYEYPAAMPTVELSSVKLDLFRRDFTINAMAVHLNPDKFGILVDFFNCQNDLRDRQIRVLHNLSFVEDPTRIFRAIRFEQRMGFSLGKLTAKLMRNAVKMGMYGRFSGSRFFHELQIILSEENPQPAIYRLAQFDLLKFLHPALNLDQRLKNILRETHRSLAWYKRLYLDSPYCQWQVFLLALTARLNGRQVMDFFKRFEVSERYRYILMADKVAVTNVLKVLLQRSFAVEPVAASALPGQPAVKVKAKSKASPLKPSEVYRLLHGLSIEGLLYLMSTVDNQAGKQVVSFYVTKLRLIKPSINGNDLREMGYKPGPKFGRMLSQLLEARLDGVLKSRQDEEEFLRRHYPR